MPTRNLVLSAHQAQFIARQVKSNRYQNASEVMDAALRLLAQQEAEEVAKTAALRHAAVTGMEDLQQGRCNQVPRENLRHYLDELGIEAASTAASAGQARRRARRSSWPSSSGGHQ